MNAVHAAKLAKEYIINSKPAEDAARLAELQQAMKVLRMMNVDPLNEEALLSLIRQEKV